MEFCEITLHDEIAARRRRKIFIKVPEITAIFWFAKIMSTAFGEALSDWLNLRFDPFIVVPIAGIACLVVLLIQLFAKRYRPLLYWSAVAMVAIFGTMVADVIHVQFGVPYLVSTIGFAIILAVILFSWWKVEKTLSIHSIHTRHREIFYWLTVIATFALGTAVGDLAAVTFHLGYLASGVIFAGIMLIPLILSRHVFANKVSQVFVFWFAYILTRPLGASFADFFSKPNGLNVGDGIVAIVLFLLMSVAVLFMLLNRRERQTEMN